MHRWRIVIALLVGASCFQAVDDGFDGGPSTGAAGGNGTLTGGGAGGFSRGGGVGGSTGGFGGGLTGGGFGGSPTGGGFGGPTGGGFGGPTGGGFNGPTGGGFGGPTGGGFGGGFTRDAGGFGGFGGGSTCDVVSCGGGCCDATTGRCVFVLSQTNRQCGIAGATCQVCPNGNACTGGVCLGFSGDAGIAPTGTPCGADPQCRPPGSGFCIPESVFGQSTGWPGGYCSAQCSGPNSCGANAACVNVGGSQGMVNNLCLKTCPAPRLGQSTCRANYVCEVNVAMAGNGICIPRCTTPGFTCWAGSMCDATSGYCL